MTFDEALKYLYAIAPPFHEVGAAAYKPGLDTMRRLMQELTVNSQLSTVNYPIVHVAGTNGKGSTSHLIASALAASGLKVGLYTSPHLVSFCERVRIIESIVNQNTIVNQSSIVNSSIVNRLIPEQYVAKFVDSHKPLFEQLQPSFFEITTAMAFCWLAEQKVDIAVIEVGLGGLLDATNIVTPVLSVITNIGLDHTDLLGHTLAEIATQKAGIMKPGVACVIGESHPETTPVFLKRAEECGILGEGLETTDCKIWFADQCEFLRRQRLRFAPDCELHGDYQQKNMQTAYVALAALKQLSIGTQLSINCQLSISQSSIANGFAHVVTYTGLRGRWETLSTSPLTICDTGHNSHGVATYVQQLNNLVNSQSIVNSQSVNRQSINRQLHIVFGIVADKDIDAVLRLLPVDAIYYFTQPNSHRALPAAELLARWQAIHPTPTTIEHRPNTERQAAAYPTIAEAITAARTAAKSDDIIFIGGSNYVVGDAIKLYQQVQNN